MKNNYKWYFQYPGKFFYWHQVFEIASQLNTGSGQGIFISAPWLIQGENPLSPMISKDCLHPMEFKPQTLVQAYHQN